MGMAKLRPRLIKPVVGRKGTRTTLTNIRNKHIGVTGTSSAREQEK